jgi:hypothetical protein
METLLDPQVLAATCRRLEGLTVDSKALWGRMSAHQMVCHLNDSFLLAMAEKTASPATGVLQRTVIKWLALRLPRPWPHNIPTRPEMDQALRGAPLTDFAADRARLASLLHRFAQPAPTFGVHPIFGQMTSWEWRRWGYLHADHHLRQFGL